MTPKYTLRVVYLGGSSPAAQVVVERRTDAGRSSRTIPIEQAAAVLLNLGPIELHETALRPLDYATRPTGAKAPELLSDE